MWSVHFLWTAKAGRDVATLILLSLVLLRWSRMLVFVSSHLYRGVSSLAMMCTCISNPSLALNFSHRPWLGQHHRTTSPPSIVRGVFFRYKSAAEQRIKQGEGGRIIVDRCLVDSEKDGARNSHFVG
jgi:hypothetical protein